MFRNFKLFFALLLAKGAHAENEYCAFVVPYSNDEPAPERRLGDSSALTDSLGFNRQLSNLTVTNTTVDYDGLTDQGGDFCALCGEYPITVGGQVIILPNGVACSTLSTWLNGTRTFTDPGFENSTCASGLTITLSGTCGFNSLDIFLNDNLIGSTAPGDFANQQCICPIGSNGGTCLSKEITITGDVAIQDVYNLGGENTLHVRFRDEGQGANNSTNAESQVCLDYAIVEVESCRKYYISSFKNIAIQHLKPILILIPSIHSYTRRGWW